MRISADNSITGKNQALFRKQCVFNSHLPYLEEVFNPHFIRKLTYYPDLFGRFYILVRREVICYNSNFLFVKYPVNAYFFKFLNSNGCGYVISKHHIELGHDKLPAPYTIKSGMIRKYFLGHGHPH